MKTFRTAAQLSLDLDEAQEQRLMQLNKLDEIRQDAVQRTVLIQNQRTKWHDKFLRKKTFEEGDWALLFDSWFKHFKGNLTTRWMGPYEIVTVFDNGSVTIRTIDEEQATFVVNGHRLKIFSSMKLRMFLKEKGSLFVTIPISAIDYFYKELSKDCVNLN